MIFISDIDSDVLYYQWKIILLPFLITNNFTGVIILFQTSKRFGRVKRVAKTQNQCEEWNIISTQWKMDLNYQVYSWKCVNYRKVFLFISVAMRSFIQTSLSIQRLFTYSTQLHNCWKTSNYRKSVRLATWCVFWWHPRRDEGRTTRDAEPRSGWTYATQEKRQSNGRDASKDIWSVEVWSLRRS